MKRTASFLTAVFVAAAAPAWAQKSGHDAHSSHGAGAQAAAHDFVAGEVKKVDRDAGKVTIKHGPIPSMDMPAMTMVYRAKDASALARLKAGDAIRFKAEKIDGNYTLTEFQPGS